MARLRISAASAAFLLCSALLSPAAEPNPWIPAPGQNGGANYAIEVGTTLLFPDNDEALVPIFLSSDTDVDSWQMGLDYEDLLFTLTLAEVRFTATASANLGAVATLQPPDSAGADFWQVRVDYPTQPSPPSGPLPAGTHIHVADLVFAVDRATLSPGTTIFNLDVLGDAEWAVLINDTIEATPIDGVLTLYAGDLVAIGEGVGDSFSHALVPVLAWNDAPVTELTMGLDYEDVILCGVDFGGGAVAGIAPESYEVTILPTPDGATLAILLLDGNQFPAGDGVQLFSLEFESAAPQSGTFEIAPVSGQVFLGSEQIASLASGAMEVLPNFIRGDINFDAKITIVDATLLLMYITMGAPDLLCHAGGDSNYDGVLNLVDPIYLLGFLFNAGPTPPAPYPNPGMDDSELPCLE